MGNSMESKLATAELERALNHAMKRAEVAEAALQALKENVRAGVAEMRRYVEANGFEWQDSLCDVDNVTTAIGWLGGALETANRMLREQISPGRQLCKSDSW
jgi:hypothetical protein